MIEEIRHLGQAELNINLSAIASNWNYFKNQAKNSVVSAVVKADCYGLGVEEVTRVLQDAGCNHYFVANLQEALTARRTIGASAKIFVLNGAFPNEIDYFQEFDIIPVLNSKFQMKAWKESNGTPCAVHIDTGMNRLGIRYDETDQYLELIKDLNPELIISHLACSSDPENEFNKIQLDRFNKACSILPNTMKSISASGGALLGKDFQMDLIRPGIGMYGGNPFDYGENKFKTVAYLKCPIIQIRTIKAKETYGYSRTYTAQKNAKIAVCALGYADGFLRSASNNGIAFINGKICNIVGRVSMDLVAIDISDVAVPPKEGDLVEFLGDNVKIDDQAKAMDTITYEILTRLGSRFYKKYNKA